MTYFIHFKGEIPYILQILLENEKINTMPHSCITCLECQFYILHTPHSAYGENPTADLAIAAAQLIVLCKCLLWMYLGSLFWLPFMKPYSLNKPSVLFTLSVPHHFSPSCKKTMHFHAHGSQRRWQEREANYSKQPSSCGWWLPVWGTVLCKIEILFVIEQKNEEQQRQVVVVCEIIWILLARDIIYIYIYYSYIWMLGNV